MKNRRPSLLLALLLWLPLTLPVVLIAAYRARHPRKHRVVLSHRQWAAIRRINARAEQARTTETDLAAMRAAGM